MPIVRLTLFKVTDASTIELAIQKYASLTQDAKKVRAWLTPHLCAFVIFVTLHTRCELGFLHVTHLVTYLGWQDHLLLPLHGDRHLYRLRQHTPLTRAQRVWRYES
jgi:hypothetical protein